MAQIHKRFTAEQIQLLFKQYQNGKMTRIEIQEVLGIKKTRFFKLLGEYKTPPDGFRIEYQRKSKPRINPDIEERIIAELQREKELIDDPRIPITSYNYTAVRDRLQKQNVEVSVPTIINRAKQIDCYIPHRKHKAHTREVLTTAIGALIQHDSSIHLGSPYANEKWTLITSIDDYSRMLLFADLFPVETSREKIQADAGNANRYTITFTSPARTESDVRV